MGKAMYSKAPQRHSPPTVPYVSSQQEEATHALSSSEASAHFCHVIFTVRPIFHPPPGSAWPSRPPARYLTEPPSSTIPPALLPAAPPVCYQET